VEQSLDFCGDPDRGRSRDFKKDSLFTTAIHIDSQEQNITILGGGLNSVSACWFLILPYRDKWQPLHETASR